MQVLIVEDDVRLAQALGHILKENGYDADVVHDGLTGLAYGEDGRYDVIILDVMLPKMDGFAVASALRRKGVSTPVLLLTARDAVADKITGLDSGADDYMTKPFSPAELLGAPARAYAPPRRGGVRGRCVQATWSSTWKATTSRLQREVHPPEAYKEFSICRILLSNAGPGGVEGPVDRQSMGRGVERRRQQRGGLHLVFAQEVRSSWGRTARIETLRKAGYRFMLPGEHAANG